MSDEKAVPGGPADFTETLRRIKILTEELAAVKSDVVKWKIEFDVEVEYDKITVFARSGIKGYRKVMTLAEFEAWAADIESLSNSIADEMLEAIHSDRVRAELMPKMKRASQNIKKLNSKGLL